MHRYQQQGHSTKHSCLPPRDSLLLWYRPNQIHQLPCVALSRVRRHFQVDDKRKLLSAGSRAHGREAGAEIPSLNSSVDVTSGCAVRAYGAQRPRFLRGKISSGIFDMVQLPGEIPVAAMQQTRVCTETESEETKPTHPPTRRGGDQGTTARAAPSRYLCRPMWEQEAGFPLSLWEHLAWKRDGKSPE